MDSRNLAAALSGAAIALLGGLIGLGGAEFRLPLLVGLFHYRMLDAIVVNLSVSLATVIASFVFRGATIPLDQVAGHWPVVLNLLAGSLAGSYAGVRFSTRAPERSLYRLVVALLVFLGVVLISHEFLFGGGAPALPPAARILLGLAAGLGIGWASSLLGVAGGELIIPTLVLLYGLDIKLAGSLSLAISIPTILMGLWRYHRSRRLFGEAGDVGFIGWMAAGSVAGALAGSHALRWLSDVSLHAILGGILLVSAWKMWHSHLRRSPEFAEPSPPDA